MNVAYNMDCLVAMREMPDNAFDLAVVDPPYGGGSTDNEYKGAIAGCFGGRFEKYHLGETSSQNVSRTGGTWAKKYGKKIVVWDQAPDSEYFEQLFRVSRDQIIWGGNYFELPPTRCFLVWRKLSISESFTMAMAEYAWTSFNGNAKVFDFPPQGKVGDRFHPTQKPIELYSWVYGLYAKKGMKILDTHLGSGSSRIAAYNAGLDFVGYEIDETYFKLEEERFAKHTQQMNLFLDQQKGDNLDQQSLW